MAFTDVLFKVIIKTKPCSFYSYETNRHYLKEACIHAGIHLGRFSVLNLLGAYGLYSVDILDGPFRYYVFVFSDGRGTEGMRCRWGCISTLIFLH